MARFKKKDDQSKNHSSIKLRAIPTANQRHLISKFVGCQRFVYNYFWDLKDKEYKFYETVGKPEWLRKWKGFWLSQDDMEKMLPWLKQEFPFLKDCPSHSLQKTIGHLSTGFKRWFDGVSDHPVKKKYSHGGSFHVDGFTDVKEHHLEINGKWLLIKIPKLDQPLKCRLHRNLPQGKLLKVVVSKSSSYQYHVTLMYEHEAGSLLRLSPHKKQEACGIDLGVVKPLTVVWANGSGKTSVAGSGHKSKVFGQLEKKRIEKKEKNRKRYQRKYTSSLESFKQRQKLMPIDPDTGKQVRASDKNLKKARLKIAKAYQKERDARRDFAEKTSYHLATRFEIIVFEDLSIKNMTKTVKKNEDGSDRKNVAQKTGLNREMLKMGLGNVVRLTEYKAQLYGGLVIKVDPRFTSQECSSCGHTEKANRKSQSRFVCRKCALSMNADRNAAINILKKRPLKQVA